MSSREAAVLATLVLYKAVLLAIGFFAERRTRDEADFYLGGRRLGPFVAALSASASSSSAWTLLSVSGTAYALGLSAVWLFPACVGGFALNWFVLAPALRRQAARSGALTVTEVIAGERGRPLRRLIVVLASVIIVLSFTNYIASQFDGAGKALSRTFDLPEDASILIGAGIVLAYTVLGGFWAVSLTDSLQGLVMVASCIILPVTALAQAGGPIALAEAMGDVPVEGYLNLSREAGLAGGVGFVLGLLGIGLGYPGQPHVVNRFMALGGGEKALRRARRVAMLWAVIVYSGMLVLGWSGRVLFPAIEEGEEVLVHAANTLLHPVLAGVLLAAVLSAIMSTADSQLLVAASAVSHDLAEGERPPLVAAASNDPHEPVRPPRALLLRSRLVVLAISIVAVLVALTVEQTIFDRVISAWTAVGAAFGPLLLVTVIRGPVAPLASVLAIVTGFSSSVVFFMIEATRGGILDTVLPFALALGIAAAGGRREDPASASDI